MGGETKKRLSVMARLSNLSVKYGKVRQRGERKKLLEIRREIESLADDSRPDDLEMVLRMMEAQKSPSAVPSEITVIRKRKL